MGAQLRTSMFWQLVSLHCEQSLKPQSTIRLFDGVLPPLTKLKLFATQYLT